VGEMERAGGRRKSEAEGQRTRQMEKDEDRLRKTRTD